MLRATGEVVRVEVKTGESGSGESRRGWRMALVRVATSRAEHVDVTIMEDAGRYPVTLPADGDLVDYVVEVGIRPGRGNFGPQLSMRVTGDYTGEAPAQAYPAAV